VTGEQETRLGNAIGREYLIASGQGQARLRAYSTGTRIYHASVFGTPQQVQSVEANTFFDSFRLSGPAVPTNPNPGGQPPGPNAPPPAAAAGIKITGDVFAFVQEAVKDKRLAEVDVQGFKVVPERYRHTLEEGGLLIGFEVGYGKFLDNVTINALRPIYRTKDGEKMGPWHGPVPASPATFKAKAGYVVGSMTIRTALAIDGFSMTFVKLANDGLDSKENYNSDWVGGMGGNPALIGGQGALFVGITGHINNQVPCSLGLLAVTPKS
jgi:hypothetical protein